jgi:hypothetical protein
MSMLNFYFHTFCFLGWQVWEDLPIFFEKNVNKKMVC